MKQHIHDVNLRHVAYSWIWTIYFHPSSTCHPVQTHFFHNMQIRILLASVVIRANTKRRHVVEGVNMLGCRLRIGSWFCGIYYWGLKLYQKYSKCKFVHRCLGQIPMKFVGEVHKVLPTKQFLVSDTYAAGAWPPIGWSIRNYVLKNSFFDGLPLQNGYETWWEGTWGWTQLFYSRKYWQPAFLAHSKLFFVLIRRW